MPGTRIRVVDLFSGPGGLSEGFASIGLLNEGAAESFEVVLAYEKDRHAVRTLQLRTVYHACRAAGLLPEYFAAITTDPVQPEDHLAGEARDIRDSLSQVVQNVTLEHATRDTVAKQVRKATAGKPWVLLGGPPCQAYSLVGRARNRGISDYDPAKDHRQTLYEEYLHVLATGRPDAFVLENVKGLLSATVENQWIFGKMLGDLAAPGKALGLNGSPVRYRLYSLVDGSELVPGASEQFDLLHHGAPVLTAPLRRTVVRMEEYGVPQARHRVLILGVRADIDVKPRPLARVATPTPVADVIADLPTLRSRFTDREDLAEDWIHFVRNAPIEKWQPYFQAAENGGTQRLTDVTSRLRGVRLPATGHGGPLVRGARNSDRAAHYLPPAAAQAAQRSWKLHWASWYRGDLGKRRWYANHESRGHMTADLLRYIYASSYAALHGSASPRMADFPRGLLPLHRNVDRALADGLFADRFRVQLAGRPSTTITSHIHKDGHYYIHFDPGQARSFTVREAARAQTFPDSYVFLGPRTEQFRQVGNAVPPYIAAQVATIVLDVLRRANRI